MPQRPANRWMLPPCEGPTLGRFLHHNASIQWLERLDANDEGELSTHGCVFRVLIKGKEYAIKVFKFYDPMSTNYFWGPILGEDTPLDTVAFYTDPFYAECRAYGRIQEEVKRKRLSNDIAVPCHGYLFLREEDQNVLDERKIELELWNVDMDYQTSTPGGCKPRAIVKDIAPTDTGVNSDSLERILRNLTRLNKQGIYNMDIRKDNYCAGRLVDFGSSWTEPHMILDACNARQSYASRAADRAMFDEMVREEEIPNPKDVKAIHAMKRRSQVVRG
ncbi:hypothetical protein QQS21_011038 [Conoideocrella luteorostrata]|uniref:Uncharacterized protein n=1 Tax=Conoideocrella luteorostrata TaxID=1105319 RepID=A0AAJ0CE37_9HYPO|nr:hypothetical protein QQS21_011038 [Conoideocrella luteorostrata]